MYVFVHMSLYIYIYIYIYIYTHKMYAWTKFSSELPSPKQTVHANVLSETIRFLGTVHTFCRPQPIGIVPVGTLKTLVCSAAIGNDRQYTSAFLCLSNHLQTPRDLWKGATVHDRTSTGEHWLDARHFEHLLWIVTWTPVRTQYLLNCERVLKMYYVSCK
jgi:hypothetical protein